MDTFKRQVVKVVKSSEENVSLSRGSYNWKKTTIHKITAECGHVRTVRGDRKVPKTIICKECARGYPQVEVKPPFGFIDNCNYGIEDPLARAFVETMAAAYGGDEEEGATSSSPTSED